MKQHPKQKQFAIIGLGRFGGSFCKELVRLNVDVLALDMNLERVQEFSSIASHAAELDAIDEESLQAVGINKFDYVLISLGEGVHSSVIATLKLKEMGIKHVWVKAQDEYHGKVLKMIGADKVIHPERDMAIRIANYAVSEKLTDYIKLSNQYSIVEMKASNKIAGKSLVELNITAAFNCNIIAVKKREKVLLMPPSSDVEINRNDILVVIGANDNLKRFEQEGV